MIVIDGSYGEGGGQLLRIALAFSVIFDVPIKIEKIRAKRENPGIRAQHLTAIRAISSISNAKVNGAEIGSSTLEFIPGKIKGGRFDFDVGTAGSVLLVLQSIIPLSLKAESKIYGRLIGGTEVRWSPTFDYFSNVFLKGLRKIGVSVTLSLERSGYYPAGGGIVYYEIEPCNKIDGINLINLPRKITVEGVSRCGSLPEHVAVRQANSARKLLTEAGIDVADIKIFCTRTVSPGSSITLWSVEDETLIGGDSIGEKGKPAENVGKESAEKLISCIKSNAAVDEHMADMLFPYLIFAKRSSTITIPKISSHLETEIYLAKLFKESINVSYSGNLPILFKVSP